MKTFDQPLFLSVKELEAAHYYIRFGCPALVGIPDFSEINPDLNRHVTYIEGTDFTREEYALLELGETVVDKLKALVIDLTCGDSHSRSYETLKGILF